MKIQILKIATIIATIFVFIILIILFFTAAPRDKYFVHNSTFSYSEDRGPVTFEKTLRIHNSTMDVYQIKFQSRDFLESKTFIYGLLYIPVNKDNTPGVILLPGGGITKELEAPIAGIIAEQGFAVLTMDQRGIGQTGGYYPSFEDDYMVFSKKLEPIQHISVYDALRAFDVLRSVPTVNKNNVIMSGESMGGRYAIIATALDKNIKGFIGISTAGFHITDEHLIQSQYFLSIDPDSYVKNIAPRKAFFIHDANDTVITLESANETFQLANEPKQMIVVRGCTHGYCDKMYDALAQVLQNISQS